MAIHPIPEAVEMDGELFDVLEQRPGQRRWQVVPVPTQPGDGGLPKPHILDWHHGFGATRRFLQPDGSQSALGHHDYSVNWDARFESLHCASPRITTLDLSTLSRYSGGFVFGGYLNSRFGGNLGGALGGLGGGSYQGVPTVITEWSGMLYISGGLKTWVVDPSQSTPTHLETRTHPADARIFSQDVFDNQLVIALGSNVDAVGSDTPYNSVSGETAWETFTGVKMSAFRTAKAGRLFSAKDNLVFNVLAGQDPGSLASYLPTVGEEITDETDPVRSLAEFSRGLVAGTARTVRTFDPDAGFEGRSLLPSSRLSPSEYDGRALITIGETMLYATTRAVWLFQGGRRPEQCGPELVQQNESAFTGGEPGIPDFGGDTIWWPYYFPESGDSVIFAVRPRRSGEQGVGPFVWQPFLYVASTEVRCVYFYGGTSSIDPRLFFGAGTSSNVEQIGWVQLSKGGAPDVFTTTAQPARSATIFGAADDLGTPTTVKEVDRIELPDVLNVDQDNYVRFAVSVDDGDTYTDLVQENDGNSLDSRVIEEGFRALFPPRHDPIYGRRPKVRGIIIQALAATTFVQLRGDPILYISERPAMTDQITTILRLHGARDVEGVQATVERLSGMQHRRVSLKHGPFDRDVEIVVTDVQMTEIETPGVQGGDHSSSEYAAQVTWREVPVSA